ncbi:hypothetical protein [Mycobacterium talmoniae]|uniref:6-deoxyerythronolide B hydroxylase n=1 Tax=Mycobacterium talmoniae TaxID=1858794 RepID=A0A2S8BN60_9MYCO|nr:hypothetical protein [Mycobacterium talmoniae]PQM47996.1 6-deoxyerythronolide B hydroxylase [Mycobacterium talmoniae]
MTTNMVRGPIELAGVTVPNGAANLDPDRCDDPSTFNVGRDERRRIFGAGLRDCAGERPADMRLAIEEILATFPDLRLADGSSAIRGAGVGRRGVHHLPVQFVPVSEEATV